jgi:hypothetical protein
LLIVEIKLQNMLVVTHPANLSIISWSSTNSRLEISTLKTTAREKTVSSFGYSS